MCQPQNQSVLLVIQSPGADKDLHLALVPAQLLQDVDLDSLNGKMVNSVGTTREQSDQIVTIYKRLGLETQNTPTVPVDLSHCLNYEPPFVVDKVVQIGWYV